MPDNPAACRFARLNIAFTALAELAAGPDAGRLPEMLAADDLALALMRAGADVVREAGMPVDLDTGCHSDTALLRRAAGWQAYAAGPVSELHGACGRAIARGLLRLWARRHGAGGPAAERRVGLRQARVRLLGRIRTRCAALRTQLREDAASLPHRRAAAFEDHVGRRVDALARELAEAVDWEFGDPAAPAPSVPIHLDPPPAGSARLENRLTAVLGAGFGAGVALSAARVAAELFPTAAPAVGLGAATAGMTLGGWLVRTRRLLVRRAALDRWVVEVTAALRAALEEHVATRALAAEAARMSSSTVPD